MQYQYVVLVYKTSFWTIYSLNIQENQSWNIRILGANLKISDLSFSSDMPRIGCVDFDISETPWIIVKNAINSVIINGIFKHVCSIWKLVLPYSERSPWVEGHVGKFMPMILVSTHWWRNVPKWIRIKPYTRNSIAMLSNVIPDGEVYYRCPCYTR